MFDRIRPKRSSTIITKHPVAPTPTTTTTAETDAEKATPDIEAQSPIQGWVDPYGPAPGFKGWFKLYWHDLFAFIFLGAISLWLLLWSPVPYQKYFAISSNPRISSTPNENAAYAHPKRLQYIPIIADAMLAVFAPIVTIIIVNLFGIGVHPTRTGSFLLHRGSFWDVNNGCIGVIYAIMTGATIQIIIKLAVPGMRPHFLSVCDPQINGTPGVGYGGLYFTTSVCRDHANRAAEIANALQSFPSGHSVAAWAGLFYLSLYLNAHLKIFANYHASYWKLLVFVAPLVAATVIVGTLWLDMSHNWYDIAAGSAIGILMALLSYRMCFASVWDFRWNHVPLRRGLVGGTVPGFGYGGEEMEAWSGGCATRRAGWGVGGGRVVGAPGDSSAFFMNGFGQQYGNGFANHYGNGFANHYGNADADQYVNGESSTDGAALSGYREHGVGSGVNGYGNGGVGSSVPRRAHGAPVVR